MNKMISCLCITYKRVSFLKRAIKCFEDQIYPNKELIIVYQDNDEITEEFVNNQTQYFKLVFKNDEVFQENLGVKPIKFLKVSSALTLGEKRNLSIKHAQGDFICIWDDDDFHSEFRLIHQMEFLRFSGKAANALADLTLFDERTDRFYFSPQRNTGWEGSLLCKKSEIGKYHHLNKKEDTPVLIDLYERDQLSVMEEPELYVYHFHASNTSGTSHLDEMLNYSIPVPASVEQDFLNKKSFHF